MTDIRFALAQIDTCVGDLDSNADKRSMRYARALQPTTMRKSWFFLN